MVKSKTYFSPTRIAVIALFSALSGVLYVFGFPISAIFPSWLELNFSDIPALIGTFALGPVAGSLIVLFKILIKLIIKGTTTVFVGELADLLIGLAFVLPAGIIYKRHRTFKGSLVGMAVGTVASVAMAILANYLVLVPFYRQLFFKGSWVPLVSIMQGIFGEGCTQKTFYNFYLWASVLPFNVMRCLIAILITLPIYKHISRIINKLADKLEVKVNENQTEEEATASKAKVRKRTIITVCVCAVVVLLLVAGVLLRYFLA
ncbi:MAG: ECF transporter S component [Candidatus Coproplasma sp.]